MTGFDEVLREQAARLPQERSWWPHYLYHFTDINNAVGILSTGWIYGRNKAANKKLMASDNASPRVIELTDSSVKECGRLYFRPRTPTQYRNEGYKPKAAQTGGFDASCPVPVFFCLDAAATLSLEGVGFSEKRLAGCHGKLAHSADELARFPFDKIYHDGYYDPAAQADIKEYRHAEAVREGGFPIEKLLRGIVCRSEAERQSLIFLLCKRCPEKLTRYRRIIRTQPEWRMFFEHGIFIRKCFVGPERMVLELNEPRRRQNAAANPIIASTARLSWRNYFNETLSVVQLGANISYRDTGRPTIPYKKASCHSGELEIRFDGKLMFFDSLSTNDEIIF